MTQPFDASLIDNEPVSDTVLAAHQRDVESWMTMQSALANAKLHAVNELTRLVNACNRLSWGFDTAYEPRRGEPGEIAELLQRLKPDDREKLMRDAKAAKDQRALVDAIADADAVLHARMQAAEDEHAKMLAEQQDRAEFETHDQAEKEARFQAWRAVIRR